MRTDRLVWLTLLGAFLLWGCAESGVKVLEEDRDLPLRFDEVSLTPVRKGPDLGVLVRAKLDGYGPGNPPCVFRCSLQDSSGRVLVNRLYQSTAVDPAANGGDTVRLVQAELVTFQEPVPGSDPWVEAFFPFHSWEGLAGPESVFGQLEMVEGRLDSNWRADVPRCIEGLRKGAVSARMRVQGICQRPQLQGLQVAVRAATLDTTQFDPHESDFYLVPVGTRYGFPDLFWSVGADLEVLYRSPRWKNSISGTWTEVSPPFFVDGKNAEIHLCLVDWDDDRFFNNLSDAIACWDGPASALSSDTAQPTILKLPLVKEMEVVAFWNE